MAWPNLAVATSYLFLAVIVYWQPWSRGPGTFIQPGGDQFSNVWFLRWTPFALGHLLNPLFTSWVNVPFGVNLVTNTSAPLLGLLGAPITLTAGPVAAYNTLSTIALAGSATAAYFLAQRFVAWRPAAWVCGVLYGFSPYVIGQAAGGHLNLTFVVLPPLILLMVHEVTVRQQWSARRAGTVLGLLVTAQFFVSSEILTSTVVIGVTGVAAAALFGHRHVGRLLHRAVIGGLWAAGVAGALLLYPVWFAVRGPGSISGPIQLVPEAYRADLFGLVVPGNYVWLGSAGLRHTSSVFANSPVENGSYLGITTVVAVIAIVLLLWKHSSIIRVTAVVGATAFVLSLGGSLVVRSRPGADTPGFPLPEQLFAHLPLLSNTIPVRYSLYVSLAAGLVLALGLDHMRGVLERRWRRSRPTSEVGSSDPVDGRRRTTAGLLTGVVALACLLPVIPSVPLQGFVDPATPSFFTSPARNTIPAGSVVLLYPYPSTPSPQGQLWQAQADLRFKMPGGYFLVPQPPSRSIAFTPATGYVTDTLMARTLLSLAAGDPPPRSSALRAGLGAELRAWNVTAVLAPISGLPQPQQAVAFLSWMAGRSPVEKHGVLIWNHLP